MMHISISQWQKYVTNELQEDEREVYENHLYSCDQCLTVYLQVVEASETQLPSLQNEISFTDKIIEIINTNQVELLYDKNINEKRSEKDLVLESLKVITFNKYGQQKVNESFKDSGDSGNSVKDKVKLKDDNVVTIKQKQQKPFYESTIFHYVVAVAMTLTLMASGVFSTMTNLTHSIELNNRIETPSFTEDLLNKTIIIMDGIDEKLKEDGQQKNKQKQNIKEVRK